MTSPSRFWTPAMITAVSGAVAALLVALATMAVTLGIKQDTQHIVISTNSTLSDFKKQLEVAQAKIDGLEKLVNAKDADKKVADDLAAKAVGK